MYRLIELTYDGTKESQAIYPYESKDALEGDYESKLGQAMLNGLEELLIGVDNVGKVIFNGIVGGHVFAPRLFEAKYTDDEAVDLAKYDDENTARARFHTKKGAAIKNSTCRQEVLLCFGGYGEILDYCHWIRSYEPTEETTEE